MDQIPQIIHYCWFGNKPKSQSVLDCIASWEKNMPDYEIRCWGNDSFDFESIPFLKSAKENKRWAFMSDFIRHYALYTYGGIYLDTDVFALKSFDPLLCDAVFIGTENPDWIVAPESAIIGGKKGHPIFKEIMRYYEELVEPLTDDVMNRICEFDENTRTIYNPCGDLQLAVAPVVIAHYLEKYGYKYINEIQKIDSGIVIYPQPIFVNYKNKFDSSTYAIHYNTHTWVNPLFASSDGRGLIFKFCKRFNLHKTYALFSRTIEKIKNLLGK